MTRGNTTPVHSLRAITTPVVTVFAPEMFPLAPVLLDPFNRRLSGWREHMRASYSERTVTARAGAVDQLVTMYAVPDGEITEDHVRAFLDEGDYEPWTVLTYLRHFRKWCQYLGIEDATRNIPRPKSPHFQAHPVAEAHLDHLIEHADDRMRRWIMLGAETGMRSSETAHLTAEQFQEGAGGRLNVQLPYPNKEMALIPVPGHVADEIRPLLDRPGRLWNVTPLYLSSSFHEYADSLGYDYGYGQLMHRFGVAVYRQTRDLIKTQHMLRRLTSKATAAFVAAADETDA